MIIGEFVDVFPPDLDGVGMVTKSYVEQLNKMGHTCYYVAPRGREPYAANFPVINYSSVPVPGEPYTCGIPYVNTHFNADVRKIGFQLIHAHSPFSAGMEAFNNAFKHKIPLVSSFHSKYYDDFLGKTGSPFIAEEIVKTIIRFYNKCDEVWTVNHATAKVLADYGYEKEIIVMPNGTNLWYPTQEDKLAAQEKYNLGTGPVLLFVGQHNFKKNIRHIIEAAAVYKEKNPDFKLLFVGQGPDEEAMHKLVEELGLHANTVFAGHLSDRKVMMQIFARADLFVFPSLYDNAPMVVREAAAAGTPSIVLRGSCSSEGIEDNVNGFLAEDSPEDIARRIETALPIAGQVGAAARDTIPLPWSKVMETACLRYENLIRRFTPPED